MTFIHLPPCPEECKQARALAANMGRINRSIRQGEGNFVGFLGELAAVRYLSYLGAKRENTYQHDLTIGPYRFDVKTKQRSQLPREHYQASVADYQDQKCHALIFASVMMQDDQPQMITLCGYMSRKDFYAQSDIIRAGDVDPENGWQCSMDCRNIEYKRLKGMFDLECQLMLAMGVPGA